MPAFPGAARHLYLVGLAVAPSSRQGHEEDSTFNDFFFWRRPLSPCPGPSSRRSWRPPREPHAGSRRARASPPPLGAGAEEELDDDDDWQQVDEGEYGEEDADDGDDPAAALLPAARARA